MRNNSFDIIRHFAACLVLYSHHYALSGRAEPMFLHWETYGAIAVIIFFAISGYFMPRSFTSSGNFKVYLTKRCLRIFPGLIVCTFLMCYIIGPIFTPMPALSYLMSYSTFKGWASYVLLRGGPINGVFSEFIYPNAINGSLWTLCTEFASYVIIGIALCFSNSWKSILPLLFISIIMTFLITFHKMADFALYSIFGKYLVMFGIGFTTGALMSVTEKYWLSRRIPLVALAILLLYLFKGRTELAIFAPFSLAILMITIGVTCKDKLINAKFDISYGIYIYAFPIQQIVINSLTQKFWLSLFISGILTAIAAYFSYRFVEKPFLYANRKSRNKMALNA